MTKEQIEHAADIYALPPWDASYNGLRNAFIAGAESRQPEIDELVEALKDIRETVMIHSSFVALLVYAKANKILKKTEQP